ncbi:hypothetical protein [Lentzea sp. CA-135723]|uniref:hypothetical protein n=1 Tax=Lentzea sp. CA-135723 TaxID=3239950 RepID=UPI003D8CC927
MCRAGGRRCNGGSGRATQATRKQRSRAKEALREAKASGDPEAIRTATERLAAADAAHAEAKENAMAHNDHHDETAAQDGDVTTPKLNPIIGAPSDKPVQANTWGALPTADSLHYHDDGPVGTAVRYMGDDARMDVDGEPLANVVGRIATNVTRRKTTAQQAVNDLKQLRDRLPEGSRAKQCVSQAVREMDGPDTPAPQVPDGTPEPLRELVGKLHAIPLVRKEPEREMQPLLDLCERAAKGDKHVSRFLDDDVERLHNKRHESLGDSGKFEIDDAVNRAVADLQEQQRQQRQRKRDNAGGYTIHSTNVAHPGAHVGSQNEVNSEPFTMNVNRPAHGGDVTPTPPTNSSGHQNRGAGSSGDVTYTFHGAANVYTGDGIQFNGPHQRWHDRSGASQPWGQYETTDGQGRRNRFQFHGPANIDTGGDIGTPAQWHAEAEAQRAGIQVADTTAQAHELMRRHNIPAAPGGGMQIDVINGRITRINGHRID